MKIKIDKHRDSLLESYAVGMLKDFYLLDTEQSPQEGLLGLLGLGQVVIKN